MPDSPPKQSKSDRTRARMLEAARALFAEQGYESATVREIAARAGVDAALVIRYFGSKEALFTRAAEIRLDLPDLAALNPAAVGEALVRRFLAIWEDGAGGLPVILRSAASNEEAAALLRAVFGRQVMPALARLVGEARAPACAALVSSQLLGLAFCRYVLKLPPLVAMEREALVRHVAPTIQRYLIEPGSDTARLRPGETEEQDRGSARRTGADTRI